MAKKKLKLSPPDRAIAIDILTLAHQQVRNTYSINVCSAIQAGASLIRTHLTQADVLDYKRFNMVTSVETRLKDRINESLGSSSYVTGWLYVKSAAFRRWFDEEGWMDDPDSLAPIGHNLHVREYRMAWIDSMIRQCQNGNPL